MLSKVAILYIIVINNLPTVLLGNSLKEISGEWIGNESFSNQSISYDNKDIELRISQGGDRDGFLIYESTSSQLYNQELSWTFHYLQYNNKDNSLIFYRRFLTPLGIIGSQQIIYLISENSLSSITLESEIADSSFSHKMILNRSTLYAKDLLPANFSLTQNYPNPFNPSTTIIVHMQDNTNATLDIVNLNGKSIRTLFVGNINIGISKFKWDGSDETGKPMASGTYFYRLKTKSSTDTKKMVLLR